MEVFLNLEAQAGATYHDQLRIARCAERSGIGGVFRADHVRSFGQPQPPGPSDAWATLAGLARDTSALRLGTLMSCVAFRLPAMLAITVAGIDQMSGGRIEVGLGAGWFEQEHASVGASFDPPSHRMTRLEEHLEIVLGLWGSAAGETFDFHGRFHNVTKNPGLPKPVQTPHPPIIIGGNGKSRTPTIAARYADEYNIPRASLASVRALRTRAAEVCRAIGRDPATLRTSVTLQVCCGPTPATAAARARKFGWVADESTIIGTPNEVLEALTSYAQAGVSRVYCHVTDFHDDEHIKLLGTEVASVAGHLATESSVNGHGNGGRWGRCPADRVPAGRHTVPVDGSGDESERESQPGFVTKRPGALLKEDRFRVPWSPRTFVRVTAVGPGTGDTHVEVRAVDDQGQQFVLELAVWHPVNLD